MPTAAPVKSMPAEIRVRGRRRKRVGDRAGRQTIRFDDGAPRLGIGHLDENP
jgi:hypothetical protein